MEVKISKKITECNRLWKNFSPNRRLFDIWDYRSCFYKQKDISPYFIVGKERGKTLGMIPLAYNKKTSQYTYFGGWFPERNTFFVKNKRKLNQMLDQCPYNTFIEGIDGREAKFSKLIEDEYTYFIDLAKYGYSFDKYFGSFRRKKQKNINRDLSKVPKYKIRTNKLIDYKKLVELNIKQFGDDSIYHNKLIKDGMRDVIKTAHKKRKLHMMSVQVGRKIQAVDVCIKHGKWFHVLTGAANTQKIPNLGKLMTVLNIKSAIENKTRYVDFLASSGYWKDQWHFDKEMLFKFSK